MPRVLIIEDNAQIRQLVAASLNANRYEVLEAEDGRSGLEMAKEYIPDLILCDIGLPYLDGFQVLELLRSEDATADILVIMLTAFADHEHVRQGMSLGADDFLAKPFSVPELMKAVETQIEKRAQRRKRLDTIMDELRDNISRSLPHELRTAIMIIEGYAQLALEDKEQLDSNQQFTLTAIRDNAERLRALAEKFLWYMRAQWPLSEKMRASVVYDCDHFIQQIAYESAANTHRLHDLHFDLETGNVRIPSECLEEILREVVDNAFKFSEQGSAVVVRSEIVQGQYHIYVIDKGRGFDIDQLNKIGAFMQFERQLYEQQGSGLGLVIAKRLTEAVDGQFAIQRVNNSTIVEITLPCGPNDATTEFNARMLSYMSE